MDDYPRCETCRHWELPEHRSPGEMWGWCQRANSSGGQPHDPGTSAWAKDWEQYQAVLVTLPAFGCIQHELR